MSFVRTVTVAVLLLTTSALVIPASAAEDGTAPELTGLSFAPSTTYDVQQIPGGPTTVTVTATDDMSGIDSVTILMSRNGLEDRRPKQTASLELSSGTSIDGAFEAELSLIAGDPYRSETDWLVEEVKLTDVAGNQRVVSHADLETRSLASTVTVINLQENEHSTVAIQADDEWHIRRGIGGGVADHVTSVGRASRGDIPFLGDWTGDGTATPGIYRDGQWYLLKTFSWGDGWYSFYYGGRPDDFPVVGDWDRDGIDTVGVIRRGTWHLVNEFRGGAADFSFTYGRVAPRGNDIPLVGDWNGDGFDTVGIVRDGEWHLRNSNTAGPGENVFVYGKVGPRGDDKAIVGDWNHDGIDTVGVVRDGRWYLRNKNAGGIADFDFQYGLQSDWHAVGGGFAETTQRRVMGQ